MEKKKILHSVYCDWEMENRRGTFVIIFIHLIFTARAERYNHELETEDTDIEESEDALFHSFSSCSPRYSKVYSRIDELHEVSFYEI